MTNKKHPLEGLLDLDEGSTPQYDPLAESVEIRDLDEDPNDSESMFDVLDDEDDSAQRAANELIEVDDSMEMVMDEMPKVEQFYDRIDKKVETKFQEIYNFSIQAYSRQMQDAELVEGKYKARNAEVAAQYLRIALDSAKDSGHQKANKDKLKLAEKKINHDVGEGKKGGNTNNNYFIGDTNDLLQAIEDAKSGTRSAKVINPKKDEEL